MLRIDVCICDCPVIPNSNLADGQGDTSRNCPAALDGITWTGKNGTVFVIDGPAPPRDKGASGGGIVTVD